MSLQKLIVTSIFFALTLLSSVSAADKAAAQADVEKLQEQVRTLDKELAVQREAFIRKLDDVEKRQVEITAQQANSLSAIANQTTSLGNYIAYTSIAIAVFVFAAGFATYFSVKIKAVNEARVAVDEWLRQEKEKVTGRIDALDREVTDALRKIKDLREEVENEGVSAIDYFRNTGQEFLGRSGAIGEQSVEAAKLERATKIVQEKTSDLKAKPESEFTSRDLYTLSVGAYAVKQYPTALTYIEKAIALTKIATPAIVSAQYLFAKAAILGRLGQKNEEIAAYSDLVRIYKVTTTPAVRLTVARGLFNQAITFGQLEKLKDEIDTYQSLDDLYGADIEPDIRGLVATGLLNRATRLCQLDRWEEAIAVDNLIVERYSVDTPPAIEKMVLKALLGAGHNRTIVAKKNWANKSWRRDLLNKAVEDLRRAALHCDSEIRVQVLSSLGYSLFLQDEREAAEAPMLDSLRLGGRKVLDAQHKDAESYRVDPEDGQYEELLAKLWNTLSTKGKAT